MIWKTTNGLGQEVVWYSEDEYNKLKEKLEKIDWYLSVFCASCEYFDGRNFGFDLKDDTFCTLLYDRSCSDSILFLL